MPPLLSAQPEDVLAFWRQAGPSQWFRKDDTFDRLFRHRYLLAHEAALAGRLDLWAQEPEGALALVILLDQFPRNAFRGTPRALESDSQARAIARRAIESGFDTTVDAELRLFFYLPFAHSEQLADQERSVELTLDIGDEAARSAVVHRDIIQRFGRFPHRNAILGRATTPEEQRFLDGGGFAG